jgi:hypothetical protein
MTYNYLRDQIQKNEKGGRYGRHEVDEICRQEIGKET